MTEARPLITDPVELAIERVAAVALAEGRQMADRAREEIDRSFAFLEAKLHQQNVFLRRSRGQKLRFAKQRQQTGGLK